VGKHKRSLWMLLIISCAFGALSFSTLRSQSQDANTQKPRKDKSEQAQELDTSKFPIADYLSVGSSDPHERHKREAKGKKYNSRSRNSLPITESFDSSFLTTDWEVRLPAIPVAKSAAVIVGKVTSAEAYLSENKTDIYSEFEIQIEQVWKSDRSELSAGTSVVAERLGGRVRFPSGKIAISAVSLQQMPQVGSRYVLFLTHEAPMGGEHSDFFILTGYELRDGCVFPLDKTLPGHPITAYRGVDEKTFLNDLRSALKVSTSQ
jgi:hypothetical protein